MAAPPMPVADVLIDRDTAEVALEEGIEGTFPASDPIAIDRAAPGHLGSAARHAGTVQAAITGERSSVEQPPAQGREPALPEVGCAARLRPGRALRA
jgi:hypothetical protein